MSVVKVGNGWALKLIGLVITLITMAVGVVMYIEANQDTTHTYIDNKIKDDNLIDEKVFFDAKEGAKLDGDVTAVKKDISDIKEDVNDIKTIIKEQNDLLIRIEERMKKNP